ncbi:MAG: hypothetical protein FGM62_04240 [Methylobacterium sp.]|nr:hypothetical protein [Methylobacterium sp.]
MTRLLASVNSVYEALLAAENGVDFIDLKNPAEGALGALPPTLITAIVQALDGRGTLSATIGDLPMQPDLLCRQVKAISDTGVDIIKIGFFGRENHRLCMESLAVHARHKRLIAVFLADQGFDPGALRALREAGFYGAMLDTADKSGGRLTQWTTIQRLQEFIASAHRSGLICGLAGSLSLEDVPLLKGIGADFLGFRRALCVGRDRTAGLDPLILRDLKRLLHKCDISAPGIHIGVGEMHHSHCIG